MYRIRRFGVIRTATVVAVAYAIAFAIVFVPILLLGTAVAPGNGAAALAGLFLVAFLVLIVYPLIIWVLTAIACLVYNLAARLVGGIEVEIERPAAYGAPTGQPYWGPPSGGQQPWAQPPGADWQPPDR